MILYEAFFFNLEATSLQSFVVKTNELHCSDPRSKQLMRSLFLPKRYFIKIIIFDSCDLKHYTSCYPYVCPIQTLNYI